ncbi:MAG TPA: SCO family protein [Bryobacteraceae bacterium]|nr:SCO family protein [Bryobacteraceae bacterium]
MPVALAAAIASLSACHGPTIELPRYGHVPEFEMTDSTGRAFNSQSLNGKVWVADFIYTNCPGPCPRMTSQMHRLEKRIGGETDVRLVSISVDPQRDTPQVLDEYAHRFGGPSEQWIFLTGSPTTVHLLAFSTFHIGDVISRMDHSTKFALVDKHGDIRGYYSTFDSDGMPSLLKDVATLRNAS